MDFVSAHNGAIPDTAMRSPGQFDHPLVRRAKLEIAAACHAHGKVASHNVIDGSARHERRRERCRTCAQRIRLHADVEHSPGSDEADRRGLFATREEIHVAAAILLAAQAAQWGPTRYQDTLHDRASYRYYWSVLRRAHATGQAVPEGAAALFGPDEPAEVSQRGS